MDIPKTWRMVPLGELGKWGSGGTPPRSRSELYGGNIPWLKIGDLTDGPIWEAEEAITKAGLENSSAKLLAPGTILLAMYGSIGKIGITKISCATNQAIAFCICDDELIDQRYLFWGLRHLRPALIALGQGGTQQNISQTLIKQVPLPVAPRCEQRKIVEKIETLFAELDKGEESLRQVQTLLARYRQSVLKAAVTGELTAEWRAERAGKLERGCDLLEHLLQIRRERWVGRGKYKEPIAPDTEGLSALPDGWVWATVEQLGFVVSGQTPRGVEEHVSPTGDIPWFKVSSMNDPGNEVELFESRWMFDQAGATMAKLSLIPEGTIVFPKRGGAILTNKKRRMGRPGSIDLNLMAFVPMGIEGYIWSFFQLLDLRSIYDGSNVPQINYKDVAYVPIAVPTSVKEAEAIADRVHHLLGHGESLESLCRDGLARSAALRQSILKDAFSGRLVPQDPDDEPASELLARVRRSAEAGPAAKR